MSQSDLLKYIEYSAVGLNVLYIIFASIEKRICWIFGGIASLISVYLFYHMNLVSEAQLYFFYFIMAIFGWVQWKRNDSTLPIRKWNTKDHLKAFGLGILLTGLFYWIASLTNRADFILLDALTTGFSILATFMTIRKILSNWIYWIGIDLLSTYLYFSKEMQFYGVLMIVFTILAVFAYYNWSKNYNKQVSL